MAGPKWMAGHRLLSFSFRWKRKQEKKKRKTRKKKRTSGKREKTDGNEWKKDAVFARGNKRPAAALLAERRPSIRFGERRSFVLFRFVSLCLSWAGVVTPRQWEPPFLILKSRNRSIVFFKKKRYLGVPNVWVVTPHRVGRDPTPSGSWPHIEGRS